MTALVSEPQPETFRPMSDPPDAGVRAQVNRLLRTLFPSGQLAERRRQQRYPFPHLIRLTPVAEDGVTPLGDPIVAVGKHLSQHGLGFYHPRPLAHRRMIASMEAGDGAWVGFLIELTWCRFTRQGWYESGGRFRQALPP
jgi:hypothetical protein